MSGNPHSKLAPNGTDFVSITHKDTYPFIRPEQFDLHGKAVLITGASKGIGREAATSYARAGASHIALGARSDLKAVETAVREAAAAAGKAAPQVLALSLDVTSEASVGAALGEVERAFGRLDVLVNNAGYLDEWVPMAESKPDEWWRTWEINILGVYLVTRAALPLMVKGGLKTVLNISSVGAHRTAKGASAYQTSKLALIRLSEFIVADYSEQGVLSFSIHPGGVLTELAQRMPTAMHAVLGDTPQLGADTIVWLTAERREWLAGRFVSVNWDMEELLKKREKVERDDLLKVRMDVGLE